MRRIRPTMLVLAELELWPNLIAAAKEHGARVAIINGRLSDHSFPGYRRIRPLVAARAAADRSHRRPERRIGRAASARSAHRPDRVHVTGSLKYDGAQTDRNNPRTQSLRQLAGIADDDIVFLAGSTQEPEEQFAIDIFRRLAPQHPRLRLILVPRHPERFDAVAKLLDASGPRLAAPLATDSRNSLAQLRELARCLASCSSTPSASSAPGGAPRTSPSSAAASATAAART